MARVCKSTKEITFGVEIEVIVPSAYSGILTPGSYHRGFSSKFLPAGWNVQKDSSVYSQEVGFYGCEIVSPVLVGIEGLVEVVWVCDQLGKIGCKINDTCGLHVHVGSDFVALDNLEALFKRYEMAFFALNGESAERRMGSHYCHPSSEWCGDRYQSLNTTTGDQGHVEVRVWAGSIDAEMVVSAVYMAVGIVHRAQKPAGKGQAEKNPVKAMAGFIRDILRHHEMLQNYGSDIYCRMMREAMSWR